MPIEGHTRQELRKRAGELFIPSAQENENTKGIYEIITKRVVLQVKETVDKALQDMG